MKLAEECKEKSLSIKIQKKLTKKKKNSTETGFEPMRDEPMRFRISRLNHSAILPLISFPNGYLIIIKNTI